jgi:hypothetical protein
MTAAAKAYSALAALVVALLLCAGSYFWGGSNASTKCTLTATKTELHQTQAAVGVNAATQSAAAAVATDSAARHDKIETKYQTIEKEVVRYVQTPAAANACLDADGLRIWSAANRGEFDAAGAASTGHAAVPGSASSGIGQGGRPADEPRAGNESLRGLQSAPAGLGGARPKSEASAR